jgi:hypothetical protein
LPIRYLSVSKGVADLEMVCAVVTNMRTEVGLVMKHLKLYNVTMPSDILKSCYFGLRKLKIFAICGKMQMFSQKYVIYEVYR